MRRAVAFWLAAGLLALACGKYGPPVRPHPPEPPAAPNPPEPPTTPSRPSPNDTPL
jgi:hypothetical protein